MTLLGGCYDLLKERILHHGAPLTFLFLLPWILANITAEIRKAACSSEKVSGFRITDAGYQEKLRLQ